MNREFVNELLVGPSARTQSAPPPSDLQMIAEAATRIAAALESGASDASAATRIVAALEAIARDVATLVERSKG